MIETGCGGGLSVEYPEVPRGPGAFVYGGDVACDQDWPEQPEEGSVFAIMGTRTELFFGGVVEVVVSQEIGLGHV